MKPRIRIYTKHYPGYGSPESWRVNAYALTENLLLDSAPAYTDRDSWELENKFKTKWQKNWTEQDWKKAIRHKKKASELCAHCGANTIDGGISCVNKTFCKKCESFIEKYKKENNDKIEASRLATEKRNQDADIEAQKALEIKLRGAFHWRDNWFFKRESDGSVAAMRLQKWEKGAYLSTDLTIPENEWTSIVCSVSLAGENNDRWNKAREFHSAGAPAAGSAERPTPIEWQAIQDALLFTEANSGLVSDAHIRVKKKVKHALAGTDTDVAKEQ